MIARPVLSLTLATFRTAELGFLGFTVYTAQAPHQLRPTPSHRTDQNGPFEHTPFFW